MRRFGGALEAGVLVAVVVGLLWLVGALNPLPRPGVNTDRLGPDNGEMVSDYLDRARGTLRGVDDGNPHWALVSFDTPLSPQRLVAIADGERIARVLLRVPMDRVQSQVIDIGVAGSEQSVLGAESVAASRLGVSAGQWDRQSQIDATSAAQLGSGCDCVVGAVLRATPSALLAIENTEGVRAVEALPADAIAGRFAVRVLLSEFVSVVGPLPDDGPVPPPR
ncbi:hypothetical protein [Rhodococcus sp. H29-C3]|uniref:hypothetical protein n=1 Tax=Rhodococcus sp. H29-C3 TaxID=3046307 RepID=UPI0024B87C57|nr:hypothetical protein [Rhodococcus sp. H29-C3]MDJ0361012.1 hypothetical protein [Rhodococcus sp. H29-C3]